jgi:hypothetical protein
MSVRPIHSGLAWAIRLLLGLAALAACAWWVHGAPVDKGAVLILITHNHGIDESDLLTIPFLAIVGWLLWPRRRSVRD